MHQRPVGIKCRHIRMRTAQGGDQYPQGLLVHGIGLFIPLQLVEARGSRRHRPCRIGVLIPQDLAADRQALLGVLQRVLGERQLVLRRGNGHVGIGGLGEVLRAENLRHERNLGAVGFDRVDVVVLLLEGLRLGLELGETEGVRGRQGGFGGVRGGRGLRGAGGGGGRVGGGGGRGDLDGFRRGRGGLFLLRLGRDGLDGGGGFRVVRGGNGLGLRGCGGSAGCATHCVDHWRVAVGEGNERERGPEGRWIGTRDGGKYAYEQGLVP